MKPTAQGLMFANGNGPADQEQEGRLEAVLCVLSLGKHLPTDTQNHWPMPSDERGEGSLVLPGLEGGQQLTVAEKAAASGPAMAAATAVILASPRSTN